MRERGREGDFCLVWPGGVSSCESKFPTVPSRTWLIGKGSNQWVTSSDGDGSVLPYSLNGGPNSSDGPRASE